MTAVFQAVSIIVLTMGFSAVFVAFLEDRYETSIDIRDKKGEETGSETE